MFESISWQEFISAIVILIGGYYLITAPLFYSREITNIFKQKKSNHTVANAHEDQDDLNESNDLMGSVKYQSREQQNVLREEQIDIEHISAAQDRDAEEAIRISFEDSSEGKLIQTVSGLYDEIKALIEILSSSTREEAITLFQTLLSNYPQLVGTNTQGIINLFIHNECKKRGEFHIELNEINSWWPTIESKL